MWTAKEPPAHERDANKRLSPVGDSLDSQPKGCWLGRVVQDCTRLVVPASPKGCTTATDGCLKIIDIIDLPILPVTVYRR